MACGPGGTARGREGPDSFSAPRSSWVGEPRSGSTSISAKRRPTMQKSPEKKRMAMGTPPIVSRQEWAAAREQMLVKEKALTRARDALAAERRRMPWVAVEKDYEFAGPEGKASLLGLFDGRRQRIVYRAFFDPGVFGWPEHACRGCPIVADQAAHDPHLNAPSTTLPLVSRPPQTGITRARARRG